MPEFNFTLILRGDIDAQADQLFEAGCDDALLGAVDGVPYAEFDREAESLSAAVMSAIADVEKVPGIRVAHIEPDDMVTASEIAERLGRTRESIRLLASGARGDGSFPPPISHIRARGRLWRWTDLMAWAGWETPQDVTVIAAANAALELRQRSADLPAEARAAIRALSDAA